MTYEAIVVGGGPGGSTTAWRLALAGVRTLLLDAAVFPRVKICAGWVTPVALADVEIEPETYPHTIQPFTACRLAFARGRIDRWAHADVWQRGATAPVTRRAGRGRPATASCAASSTTTCSSARPRPGPTSAAASAWVGSP